MNAYMMEITMPYYKDEEFVTLIPRQRQMIGRRAQIRQLLMTGPCDEKENSQKGQHQQGERWKSAGCQARHCD